MDLEQLDIQEAEQLENLFESSALRFNKLKHTYFKNFIKNNETYLDFLKIGSRHFSFQLPENIDEIFLKKENSPLFWLLESPILTVCEKSFNENSHGNRQSDRNEIKKNFTKWVIAAEQSQKKIFAALTVKEIKSSINFLTYIDSIYYSLILIFDESIRNPYKAIEELNKAQSSVDESFLTPEIKRDLNYLIQLYKGFAFLTLGNNEEAATELSYAMDSKESGITAKFYFAYLSATQKRDDFTKALIKEILNYDLDRLNYAIDCSSIVVMNFLLNNPVFPNIVNYYEFSPYTDYIQSELIESSLDSKKIVSTLQIRLNQLKKNEFDEYFTDESRQTIKFLNDLCEQHAHNQSIFLSMVSNNINNKFHNVLDEIQSKIKETLYQNYNHVMELYKK
ncbi:MAG: hypothetical protein EHM44_04430, partial [Ignavibacteriales bacterium]